MDKEGLAKQIHSARGISDSFEFCINAYRFLSEQSPVERPEILAWFLQIAREHYNNKNDAVTGHKDLLDKLDEYSSKYKKLVQGLIDAFSVRNYTEKQYYQKLWDSFESLLPDATEEEKGFCLFSVLADGRTPYYELPSGLQLSKERFREMTDEIQPFIQRLDFVFQLSRSQRTEFTSRVVHLLDKLDSLEQKSVLLVYLWYRLERHWETTSEESARTGRTAQTTEKPGKSPSVDDVSKNTEFLLQNIQNEDEEALPVEIIASYQYPNLNSNEYAFVLLKKGEDIFLSDQGKTLEQLDRIFELREPEVIKNLNAILKQYGVIKQGNEFVVKIDNWNGNTNEDENEDLKKCKLSLFSCVSFMLNMKIFYI